MAKLVLIPLETICFMGIIPGKLIVKPTSILNDGPHILPLADTAWLYKEIWLNELNALTTIIGPKYYYLAIWQKLILLIQCITKEPTTNNCVTVYCD